MRSARTAVFVVVASVTCVGSAAHGQLLDLRMDISTFQGSTPGNWNNIGALLGTTPGLVDFNTGAPTAASLTGAGGWSDFFGDDLGAFPDQDWLTQPATVDGAGLQAAATGTFEVSGLQDGLYKVEVVSARTSFDYLNTITVDGALADRTFLGTAVQTPWASASDGLDDGNWLIWDDVSPIAGSITIIDVAGPGTLGVVNAIRVVQIPAPGVLAFIGVAGLCGRRRRRCQCG